MSRYIVMRSDDSVDRQDIDKFFKTHKIIHWQYLQERPDWYGRIVIEYEEKRYDD